MKNAESSSSDRWRRFVATVTIEDPELREWIDEERVRDVRAGGRGTIAAILAAGVGALRESRRANS